ncbi:5'-methylthioadenosine/adenosylhomocysteine nucleosidase [Thiomonas bhubaneswarensis]|uniref:adenosylhomocysteine nucleosidase n=1 Tax=Thiomonas bhubaneswarensis TaxID=339866 RepID=A0A0K6HY87_9BURK|nr:5'-methylthioadenosine/adenosylhomocysteine nucleosidase [Thiomonas bhubaneswarensis]CUA95992.1 5'-methylthioadenosine/S-adenosylhomocysteine nucleosidase [Thiomonas bhubaneswarensis]
MSATRTGIVSAIAQEQEGLLAALQGPRKVRHGSRDYTLGTLWGHEVALVLCGIGKVAAAATTTSLIVEFGCDALLFTGVAGGLAEGVRVGDVVIADTLLQHDLDARPLYPQYEVPDTGRALFAADRALSDRLHAAAQALFSPHAPPLLDAQTRHEFKLHAPQVHRGLIVSGDRFISTREGSDALRLALPDALAVEMEGAAVAQVCHDYGVPFALVRTLSDRADDTAHLDFGRFIRAVASAYSTALLAAMLAG